MNRRHSHLMSNLRFIKEKQTEEIKYIENQGWRFEHFDILFALNTFYLLVLGPLASSARGRAKTVWRNTSIQYGEVLLFDNQRAEKIRSAHHSFSNIARRIPGGLNTITGNQASDIVFKLYRAMKNDYIG